MLVNMYSIFDSKAKAWLHPWFAQSHPVAFRNLDKACRNPNSPFVDFPADFSLFRIATFDEVSGEVSPVVPAENLGNMTQFMPPETPQLSASNP